jgi:hypothetical protein
MEKTIREICLLCNGERWLEDLSRPGQSRPCGYCDSNGWVLVAAASVEENPALGQPLSDETRKKD